MQPAREKAGKSSASASSGKVLGNDTTEFPRGHLRGEDHPKTWALVHSKVDARQAGNSGKKKFADFPK